MGQWFVGLHVFLGLVADPGGFIGCYAFFQSTTLKNIINFWRTSYLECPGNCPWTYRGTSVLQILRRTPWLPVRGYPGVSRSGGQAFKSREEMSISEKFREGLLEIRQKKLCAVQNRRSTPSMVWPTLASRTAKDHSRLHAKHESGLIDTDVLWSLGLLVTTAMQKRMNSSKCNWGLVA